MKFVCVATCFLRLLGPAVFGGGRIRPPGGILFYALMAAVHLQCTIFALDIDLITHQSDSLNYGPYGSVVDKLEL